MDERASGTDDKYLLSSVNNTLSLLDTLAAKGPMTLAELDRSTSFGKTSLFRMLHTLEVNDFIFKDSEARYSLGLKLLYLGSSVIARQDLADTARPRLRAFCTEQGLSTHLARLSGSRAVTIDVETPLRDLQITGRVGMSPRAHSTAMGRAILANLSDAERDEHLRGVDYVSYTDSSVKSEAELVTLLEQVKCDGFALDVNDRYPGFGSIAAPIFDYRGMCVAACGIVALSQTIAERTDELSQAVISLAADITGDLGYRSDTRQM